MKISISAVSKGLAAGKYIVAVSGGVDSVVLLDLLRANNELDLVVAHFDHGIRAESNMDAEFVKSLAHEYDLPFELGKGNLGAEASEAEARQARYTFLRSVKEEYGADAIITAHHQDDLIETAVINLLRGTYRKGVSSLKSTDEIKRPLLKIAKSQILKYAQEQGLKWREDSTNTDTRYLRNYVRHVLIPNMEKMDFGWRQRILKRINKAEKLNQDINDTLDFIALQHLKDTEQGVRFERHWLIMLPNSIGREVLVYALQRAGVSQINSQQLKRVLIFCKTAKSGKRMEVSGGHEIVVDDSQILVTN